jgi:hypothetical protein
LISHCLDRISSYGEVPFSFMRPPGECLQRCVRLGFLAGAIASAKRSQR